MKQDQAFGALWVQGEDASVFLNGQLSVDVATLKQQWAIGAYCSPQGKVIAIIWILNIVIDGEQGFLLLMPSELLENVKKRLEKYILRSKVSIKTQAVRISLQTNANVTTHAHFFHNKQANIHISQTSDKHLTLTGFNGDALLLEIGTANDCEDWPVIAQKLIKQGIALVYQQTSELFVPQMLGLAAIGGVDFAKGCYVGQEVVARLHYKSTVRQILVWTKAPANLSHILLPGANLFFAKRKAGTILAYHANENEGVLQAVIRQDFIDKLLHIDSDSQYSFIFTSARTSSQGN